MESMGSEQGIPCGVFGDRSTSDVVVRLRTQEGRDEWLYCHSQILVENCKYFSDRLSEDWPTCQIIDSRNCVELYSPEPDFDHHVALLRLFYSEEEQDSAWHNVRNALAILRVAHALGCPGIASSCVGYLEAVPWEESEEEEILRVVPQMGCPVSDPILARLQPVDPRAVRRVFLSSLRFATSSPAPETSDVKSSAQEQIEYMLAEDDEDSPLVAPDEEIKSEARDCFDRMFERFDGLVEAILGEPADDRRRAVSSFRSSLGDLLWAFSILTRLEAVKGFVANWVESSEKIVEAADPTAETWSIVVAVAAKVIEAMGNGCAILTAGKRVRAVRVWLPFVGAARALIEDSMGGEGEGPRRVEAEVWQALESGLVAVILALPASDQAEILTDWLGNEPGRYPDLTEAFEVWCYRSKVAKRRLALVGGVDTTTTIETAKSF